MVISNTNFELLQTIEDSLTLDSELKGVIERLKSDPNAHSQFTWYQNKLRRKGRLVIREVIRQDIITLCHATPLGGHSGIEATLKKLLTVFYWKGMTKNVKVFVQKGDGCQRSKAYLAASPGLLQLLPIPEVVWSQISMDFIDGVPKSHGYEVILVVVDRLSKYDHFIPLRHPYIA